MQYFKLSMISCLIAGTAYLHSSYHYNPQTGMHDYRRPSEQYQPSSPRTPHAPSRPQCNYAERMQVERMQQAQYLAILQSQDPKMYVDPEKTVAFRSSYDQNKVPMSDGSFSLFYFPFRQPDSEVKMFDHFCELTDYVRKECIELKRSGNLTPEYFAHLRYHEII